MDDVYGRAILTVAVRNTEALFIRSYIRVHSVRIFLTAQTGCRSNKRGLPSDRSPSPFTIHNVALGESRRSDAYERPKAFPGLNGKIDMGNSQMDVPRKDTDLQTSHIHAGAMLLLVQSKQFPRRCMFGIQARRLGGGRNSVRRHADATIHEARLPFQLHHRVRDACSGICATNAQRR